MDIATAFGALQTDGALAVGVVLGLAVASVVIARDTSRRVASAGRRRSATAAS